MEKQYDFQGFASLEEFGYIFNSAGEMRHKDTDKPFTFDVKPGNGDYNQKHYEALGNIVTLEIYKLLEQRTRLEKLYLDRQLDSFIFVSKDYKEKEKLLCLIHGSGVVRAGQWARRLIINNDIGQFRQQNIVSGKTLFNSFGKKFSLIMKIF